MVEAPRRQRRKTERPKEILAAALVEFSSKGFAATRLDDVASRAGITKGTIYVYFPSKEDLFIATLKELSHPLMDHLSALTDDPDRSAMEILREHLTFVTARIVQDPVGRELFQILLAEGQRFPTVMRRWHAEVMEPATRSIAAVLRRGVERNEFRSGSVEAFPQLIMAPVLMCKSWPVVAGLDQPLDAPRFIEAAVDLFAHGLLRD